MTVAYVTEYDNLGKDEDAKTVQAAKNPPVTDQTVTFTTTTQSATFNGKTKLIRIACASASHYLVGANPTATTSKALLPANTVEYLSVNPGDKIAFVDVA